MKTTWALGFGLLLTFRCRDVSRADCAQTPETRKVVIDKGNADGGSSLLKSYRCSLQPQGKDADLRVQYFRTNEATAGTHFGRWVVQQVAAYAGLTKSAEQRRLALLRRPRECIRDDRGDPPDAGSHIGVGSALASDFISMKKFKHIEVYKNELEYPAAEEIASLRRKILPGNLSYLYESSSCDPGVGDCVKYGEETLMLRVWRPMDASDVAQYAERAAAYNTDVVKTRKGCGKDCAIGASPAKSLQLLARAAGPNWPNDLVILTGRHTVQSKAEEGGCLGMGRDFWSFAALTRDIYVDFMLVENASPRPVTIDAMIGMYHKSPELRAVSSEGSTGENIPIVVDQLAAGQRMLIPMRIVLATDNYTHGLFDDYKVSMEQIHRVLGGATGYAKAVESYNRTPKFKDYSYGPTLSIDGLVVNGTKLSMAKRRSSNSIDLSTVAEIGSCPYLLSWDEKGREWVEHGKVLHKAPAKDKSYTEARDFEGLRTNSVSRSASLRSRISMRRRSS